MDNEKVSYEELVSLQILNKFLNLDITNFVKSESPDWKNYNENIGLEVTIVDDSKNFFQSQKKLIKIKLKIEINLERDILKMEDMLFLKKRLKC